MSTKLEETKGKIKLVGKVVGISNENAYREGFTKSDDSKPYKTLSFFVQTSEQNRVKVELFGMEREHVYAYSQKDKKSKQIKWDERNDNHGSYKVIGINAFLEDGADGKKARKVFVEYDAIDYIKKHLKDGDSVRITGKADFQQFEVEGEMKTSTKFNFNSITKLDEEIDFEAENFKETAIFEQEIVVTDKMVDKEAKALIISANIIKYGGEVVPTSFVVNSETHPKLANNMSKRLGFGDFIKVYGLIINATILEEAPQEVVEDDDDWGGDTDIKEELDTNYVKNYITELRITSVDSSTYEKKKYKEDDFLSEDEDAFNGDIDSDEDEDPFADEDEKDDLPFD